jgi:hypothetical protein
MRRSPSVFNDFGHHTHLHKGHGTELTRPRATSTLPRRGQGAGLSTQGFLPLNRDDIFIATGNRAEADGEGVPRQAHTSERLNNGHRAAEAGEQWRPKVVVNVMLHRLGGDDDIAYRQSVD